MYYYYPMMWRGETAFFMLIFWLLLIMGIIFLVRFFINSSRQGNGLQEKADKEDSAVKILRERYAKGEINEEEYKTKIKNLESQVK